MICPTLAAKAAVVCPAATVIEAGTVTLALPLVSATVRPPLGAASVKTTEQEEVPGAFTEVGVQFRALNCGTGLTVMVEVLLVPPAEAVTTDVVEVVTEPALAAKVLLVAPANTVTEAGTVNALSLLETLTAVPPIGAPCVRVAVQVAEVPGVSDVGLQASEDTAGADGSTACTVPPVADNGIE